MRAIVGFTRVDPTVRRTGKVTPDHPIATFLFNPLSRKADTNFDGPPPSEYAPGIARLAIYPPSLLALACLAMLPGCSVCHYAKLTSRDEPALFSRKVDKVASLATYRALADQAWAETGAACPPQCTYEDYAWGFRQGFADYVYAGGNGEPPAVAPRPYWQVDMRNPAGAATVQSWFEGYRHGARVAREGGYRQTATVLASASVRDCTPCGCPEASAGYRSGCDCNNPEGSLMPAGPLLAAPFTTLEDIPRPEYSAPPDNSAAPVPRVAPENDSLELPALDDVLEPPTDQQRLLLAPPRGEATNTTVTSSDEFLVKQTQMTIDPPTIKPKPPRQALRGLGFQVVR